MSLGFRTSSEKRDRKADFSTTWRYDFIFGEWAQELESAWDAPTRDTLRTALETLRIPGHDRDSINRLARLALCDRKGRLTEPGVFKALEGMNVEKQCEVLRIPLHDVHSAKATMPEDVVVGYVEQLGYKAWSLENRWFGDLMNFIFLRWSWRKKLPPRGPFGIGIPNFMDGMAGREKQLFRIVKNTSTWKFKRNIVLGNKSVMRALQKMDSSEEFHRKWRYVHGYIEDELAEFYPRLFAALGAHRLALMFEAFASDPLVLSAGWPDIIAIPLKSRTNRIPCSHNNGPILIEVKEKDSLSLRQMITIHTLRNAVDLDIRVYKVDRQNT